MNKKMRARKRRQARRVALTLVLMLTVALVSIGGTLAWLTAQTDEIVNTFTVGDIDITLTETEPANQTAKMVPGNTIVKNPTVGVNAGSEACYLFVKIEESTNPVLDEYIAYTVADGWNELTAGSGIYWRTVDATTAAAGVTYPVLEDNKVTVKNTVTKAMMETLEATNAPQPTLTFTAYACQSANVADAATAWANIQAA